MEPELGVTLKRLRLAHPVINASGTFDVLEAAQRYEGDLFTNLPFSLYVPKTVTLEPRRGNPPPRVTEVACGVVNSVGLANPGLDRFLEELPRLAKLSVPVLVNVGGSQPDDYVAVVQRLEQYLGTPAGEDRRGALPQVVGYELNVSCPNVATGLAIGSDASATAALVAKVRAVTQRLLVVKLTPNVTDVAAVALAAEQAGADAVSLINTLKALVLDRVTLKPFLGGRTGGLSGPAVKPIALCMVAEVASKVRIPVIGMGGISCGRDVLEFVACGATAVAVGTASFSGIGAAARIVAELRAEMVSRGLSDLGEVRGIALT